MNEEIIISCVICWQGLDGIVGRTNARCRLELAARSNEQKHTMEATTMGVVAKKAAVQRMMSARVKDQS